MKQKSKKSQGEIFGIMIFFVLLIIGFLLYSQFKVVYTSQEQDTILQEEYKILVDSTMKTLKEYEIQCFSNSKISTIDLLQYCVDNTGISSFEHQLSCDNFKINSCKTLLNTVDSLLHTFFNSSSALHSQKPFEFTIIPSNEIKYSHLNVTLSNIKYFNISTNSSNSSYYLRQGYSKISSDFENIPTNQGTFELELIFYHKR